MKILLVGPWQVPWHQDRLANSLNELGVTVLKFSWSDDFWVHTGLPSTFKSPLHKLQYRLVWGPIVTALQKRFLATLRRERPQVVFLYGVQHILASTLRQAKEESKRTLYIAYHNDDPFSPHADRIFWREARAGLAMIDHHFVYRPQNVDDLRQLGLTNSSVFIVRGLRPCSMPIEL